MSQSHLNKPASNPVNPQTTPSAPVSAPVSDPMNSNEPSSLLSAIARILLLRRTAGRTEPVAPSVPHNDNASPDAESAQVKCPEVEWAMQMMN